MAPTLDEATEWHRSVLEAYDNMPRGSTITNQAVKFVVSRSDEPEEKHVLRFLVEGTWEQFRAVVFRAIGLIPLEVYFVM